MANYNSSHTGAEIDSAIGRVKDTAVTAGTVAASLGVVVDANKDISGFRNVTLTGQLQAATINLTGDTTIGDGDSDNITINADVNSNIIPNTDNTFDLGSASKQWKDLYVNGIGYIDQLGTDADPIAIYASSGEIDGTAIGSESASTGAFTTINASGNITGNLVGNVTGNVSGTAATVTGAAQSAITSVGTLSSLTLGGDLTIPQKIVHSGDTDTFLSFGDDSLSLYAGNASASVVDFLYGNIYLKTNDKAFIGYTTGGGAKELIKVNSSDKIQIGESSIDIVLNTTGNVGVGTTSPSYKLHVAEDLANDYAAYIINDNADGSGLRLRCDDSDGDEYLFYAENSTTARFAIKSDGKVGIGQTTLNAMLDIDDGATGDFNHIGKAQIRVGSINNVGVRSQIGFGWGGDSTYMPVTVGAIGTSGSGYVKADFVINTRDATTDSAPTERMRISSTGAVTKPTTPAFCVVLADQTDISTGTSHQLASASERFDQGGDFASNQFRAPATGKYQLNCILRLTDVPANADYITVQIITSNENYSQMLTPTTAKDYETLCISALADMDANDTAHITFFQSGGTNSTNVDSESHFSGYLAC